jgi:hypothetical protein
MNAEQARACPDLPFLVLHVLWLFSSHEKETTR